jgi:hypothetical protein
MQWDSHTGAKSFIPPSDTSSYFDKITAKAENEIRNEINQQVRQEANDIIHKIVTAKDADISKLEEIIKDRDKEILDLRHKLKNN